MQTMSRVTIHGRRDDNVFRFAIFPIVDATSEGTAAIATSDVTAMDFLPGAYARARSSQIRSDRVRICYSHRQWMQISRGPFCEQNADTIV
jgi:hypothetical protein